jgi:hypothetical protein
MAYNPITNPQNVAINEISTGGGLMSHYLATGALPGVIVSATPGKITGWYIYNNQTTVARVAIYDAATVPALGSTLNLKLAIVIPPSSGANVALPAGLQFSTGIVYNIGADVADTNTTAATAGSVSVNIFYKN